MVIRLSSVCFSLHNHVYYFFKCILEENEKKSNIKEQRNYGRQSNKPIRIKTLIHAEKNPTVEREKKLTNKVT